MNQPEAQRPYPPMPKPIIVAGGFPPFFTAADMRAYVDADRAQAPVAGQPAEPSPANVDYLGLALDLEKQAARVESQTAQRAMLAGAHGLRLMGGKVGCPEPERCRGKQCEYCRDMAALKSAADGCTCDASGPDYCERHAP